MQPNASAWVQNYAYDAIRRLTNVVSPAGAFSYDYAPVPGAPTSPSALIKKLALPNGAYVTNSYDAVARILSTKLNNSAHATLNSHAYGYNVGSQRTNQVRADGSSVNYTYDSLGQLKTAFGYENGGAARLHEKFGYLYDAAGNLSKRTNNALIQTLGVNSLNQLTTGTRSGTLTVAGTTTSAATNVTVNSQTATRYGDNTFAREGFALSDGNNAFTAVAADNLGRLDTNTVTVNLPSTVNFAYDQNGNLTGDGRRMLAYDDENQLESVIVTNGAGSSTKSEFSYDGLFRRRVRKEYTWSSGIWNLASEIRYIYDGRLVLQERDANNLPAVTYTRGVDLSGTRQGAGGIGGLLARTDNTTGLSAFYHADGNGNITALVNGQQVIVARYTYNPFGNILALSGPLADANLYRFSSKEYHEPSGLVYYLYRFYDPNLQRWINRDPVEEQGGLSLYAFTENSPLNSLDPQGFWTFGLGVQAMYELAGAFGFNIGVFVGHNPDNGKWSFGFLFGPEAGGGGPFCFGGSLFGQWTNAKSVGELKGLSNQIGFSVGEVFPIFGADGIVGLGRSGITYEGLQLSIGAGLGLLFEIHDVMIYMAGWDSDGGWS